jgi:(S)-2-hydroxy-acid oxidase
MFANVHCDFVYLIRCIGIWVSNHGARQLDTTPATIEVLPDICRAVGKKCEVYLDGGVTRGTDVLKVNAFDMN